MDYGYINEITDTVKHFDEILICYLEYIEQKCNLYLSQFSVIGINLDLRSVVTTGGKISIQIA